MIEIRSRRAVFTVCDGPFVAKEFDDYMSAYEWLKIHLVELSAPFILEERFYSVSAFACGDLIGEVSVGDIKAMHDEFNKNTEEFCKKNK